MTQATLYIVGDSFTQPPRAEETYLPWFTRLAVEMNMKLVNCSGIGVSQDFCMQQLSGLMHLIKPEDKILLLLTHAGRFWFFDNRPRLTNANIYNLGDELSKEEEEAVAKYMMHLQRPPLDLLWQDMRLGWLSAHAKRLGIQAPQVVLGFPKVVAKDRKMFEMFFTHELLDNLRISKGNLLNDVEAKEMKNPHQQFAMYDNVWQGYDCRFNHLIKSNHDIMLERMLTAFNKDQPVDLTQPGWVTGVIDESIFDDQAFIEKELDPFSVQERHDKLEQIRNSEAWAAKQGIAGWFRQQSRKNKKS